MSEIIISDNYTRAYSLDKKIKANAQILQDTIFELGKSLIEMRDGKLYKELGYQNFAEYCENEVGIKKSQAYNYITIVDKLSEDFVQSTGKIGVQKLYLLSRLDEVTRNEIVKNTDVSGTSVKELERQIKELEKDKVSAKERQDKLLKKNMQLVEEIDSCKKERDEAEDTVQRLEKQLKEIENRPRDCYEDTTKIDELTAKLNEERERHKTELESLKNSEIAPEKDIEGQFRAYITGVVDSMKRLTSFVEKNSDSPQRFLFLEKLENIVTLTSQTINKLKGE